MRNSAAKSMWLLPCIFLSCVSTGLAQEIVLRELTRISGVSVQEVNDEFLSLSDGTKLTWDQVLQARVDSVWQKKLDQRLEKFGLPLYRLKHRLRQENFVGASEIANRWYEQPEQTFAGAEANFLVCRAVMLGRIAAGKRETVMEPMIRALLLQQDCSPSFLNAFKDLRFSDSEFKTQLCDDLPPVWTSAEGCAIELNRLDDGFDLEELTDRWPGVAVYLSSMAIHARQRERMQPWNSSMGRVAEFRPWQRMMNSSLSRTPLSILVRNTEGALRVSTMYWWATAEDQQAPKADRVLTLLKIVANYREEFPALSKLSLQQAIELTDDSKERELLRSVQ